MGYLNLVGSFIYKEPLFRAKLAALANNDAQLKIDGWAQSTETVFYQASVPTGWTQDAANNDKALRIVGPTGGAVTGGSQAVSSNIPLAHSHTVNVDTDGSHTHTFAGHTHQLGLGSNLRASTDWVIEQSTFLFAAGQSGGSTSITQLKGPWPTPGALTLSTSGSHSHGGTGAALSDIIFAYCDVIFGSKNAPGGTYTNLVGSFHTGDIINFDPFSQFAANDDYNKGNLMPSTTVMIWGQSSPPVGWSRVIAAGDRMLRVVSGGGGGTGGSQFISSGAAISHSHSLASVADHTHSLPSHQHVLGTGSSSSTGVIANPSQFGYIQASGGVLIMGLQQVGATSSSQTCYKKQTTSSGGGNIGSAGGHTHAIVPTLSDFVLAYVDVIECSKDSTGAPYAYTNLTAEFAWKELVSYQRLNNLAKNDAYIQFHTTPSASQALFYMASPPAGWTKITTQNDKCLRLVTGSSGGNQGGGSQLLSQTITIQHTHTVVAQSDHTHVDSHTHPVDSGTQTVVQLGLALVDNNGLASVVPGNTQAGGHNFFSTSPGPDNQASAAGAHSHGGATNSQLTNFTLAYCDVVWAAKN